MADNYDRAIEDITYDWSTDRNQHGITPTAQPGVDPCVRTLAESGEAKRARLVAELTALEQLGPPSVRAELTAVRNDLDWLHHDRQDLDRGVGRWSGTAAGSAARELQAAREQRQAAEERAGLAVGPRERRHWKRIAWHAGLTEARAQDDWLTYTSPVAESLDRKIIRTERRAVDLEGQAAFRRRWLYEHPELARRIEHAEREVRRLDDPIGAELLDRLGVLSLGDGPVAIRTPAHLDIGKVLERFDRLQRARNIDPPGLSL